jgi:hypothetical protein
LFAASYSNNKQLWLASMRLFGCLTAKALTCCIEDAEGKYTDEQIKQDHSAKKQQTSDQYVVIQASC